ncbi:MAG: methionyl-tRNA formyltransferase [Patescibacteria group bacterium]
MKYVFFGTPEFAAIILERLIKAGMPPTLVVCNPDRPAGRKKIVTSPPVKFLAEKHKIQVLQPETFDVETLKYLNSRNLDFAIVAAYSKILPKRIISSPRLGTIGVHPSLLPKYRGATPIQSVILNGEEKTGTTLFLIDEKIDHGPVLAQRELEFPILNFKFPRLLQALSELSADLLIETLPRFVRGEIKPAPQNESEATYTKKFTSQDAFIDLTKDDPAAVDRKVRALNPEPGTWTIQDGKRVKILEAEAVGNKLVLKKIQMAGKKPTLLKDR